MERFDVQVEQLADALVIRPVGEADFATASLWRNQMIVALEELLGDLTFGVEFRGTQITSPGFAGMEDVPWAGFPAASSGSTGGTSGRRFRVILDLTELSFMDSSGLQALVVGYRLAVRAGAYCCVVGARPSIASRMSVAGLTPSYIPIHRTVAEALDQS
jgi:anti-anti-sigma regulatory factor